MRLSILLAGLLLAGTTCQAAPNHFWKDKKWWIGTAVNGVVVGLDMHSTTQAQSRGGVESNPILGPHPSNGQIAGLGVGAFAFYTTVHAVEWHFSHDDDRKWVRIVGLVAIPAGAVAIHLPSAIHNYEIPTPGERQLSSCMAKRSPCIEKVK